MIRSNEFILFGLAKTATSEYIVPWFMYAVVLAVMVVYALIEASHTRKDHEVLFPEAVKWSIFYISVALLFGKKSSKHSP